MGNHFLLLRYDKKLFFSLNFWIRHFQVVLLSLFAFVLEGRHYFVTGEKFLLLTNQLDSPTIQHFVEIHNRYPIRNILTSLETSFKATIIILTNDFYQFDSVLSTFADNHLARNIALELVLFIQPFSRCFQHNPLVIV